MSRRPLPDNTRRQFLPAALELQANPPSPAGRALLVLLSLLFVTGLLWACFGAVDIVVTAPGRIVPGGRVKVVQASGPGTVSAIEVAEGSRVDAGQAVIRLDPTYADADLLRVREQLHDVALHQAWRRELEQWLADGRADPTSAGMRSRFAAGDQLRAEALLRYHRDEIEARLFNLDKDLSSNRVEQQAMRADQARAQAKLTVLRERVDAYKSLLDRQYGAKVQYLQILQEQIDLERTIPVLALREAQLRENALSIAAHRAATAGEIRKQNLLELARLDSERKVLEQEHRKLRRRRAQLVLLAPVSGAVQQLAVHTIGSVVSPGQELMKIVPEDAVIEVEALLLNRDIGFVREGQLAEVKIDTFNFTKYGLIEARVANISNDAVEDERLGWVYKMQLRLAADWIAVEDKRVTLSPGMTVSAEIKTGKRRLIEFFLSPLLRYQHDGLRER